MARGIWIRNRQTSTWRVPVPELSATWRRTLSYLDPLLLDRYVSYLNLLQMNACCIPGLFAVKLSVCISLSQMSGLRPVKPYVWISLSQTCICSLYLDLPKLFSLKGKCLGCLLLSHVWMCLSQTCNCPDCF